MIHFFIQKHLSFIYTFKSLTIKHLKFYFNVYFFIFFNFFILIFNFFQFFHFNFFILIFYFSLMVHSQQNSTSPPPIATIHHHHQKVSIWILTPTNHKPGNLTVIILLGFCVCLDFCTCCVLWVFTTVYLDFCVWYVLWIFVIGLVWYVKSNWIIRIMLAWIILQALVTAEDIICSAPVQTGITGTPSIPDPSMNKIPATSTTFRLYVRRVLGPALPPASTIIVGKMQAETVQD